MCANIGSVSIFLSDCHSHIAEYGLTELPGILARARGAGVGFIFAAGVTVASSEACIRLAEEDDLVYAGVGVHPQDLTGPIDADAYRALRRMADHPRALCISETGLDYLPGTPPRDVQHQAFRVHLRLARETGLPVIFHSREAHDDTLRILREEGADSVGAIMHYFQGDERVAEEALSHGFLLSLAKPLLRLPGLQELARRLPADSIVLETDAAPQPWKPNRRAWTEPAHVLQVAEKLGELRDCPVQTIAQTTTRNLLRVLGPKAAHLEALVGRA